MRTCAYLWIDLCTRTGGQPRLLRDLYDECRGWCQRRRLEPPTKRQLSDALGPRHERNGWRIRSREPEWTKEMAAVDALRRFSRVVPIVTGDQLAEIIGIKPATMRDYRRRGVGPRENRVHALRYAIRLDDAIVWAQRRGEHARVLKLCDWGFEVTQGLKGIY